MSVWQYLILFFSVILGGGVGLYLQRSNRTALQLVLSFSGAYILGITALHLMPTAFLEKNEQIGLWLLLGFFIQLLLEQLSWGVEHGHVHGHRHEKLGFAVQVMAGLSLHAFLEGMPLSVYNDFHAIHHGHEHDSHHLLFAIILHKAPAAFALVVVLLVSGFSRNLVVICLVIFAAMSPLGAWVASGLALTTGLVAKLIAVVIGSFLHIATTILFEADDTHQHKISWKKLAVILAGLGMSILTIS